MSTITKEGAKPPRKYRKYPPATAARGATPELVARALLRRQRPENRLDEAEKPKR